MMNRREALKAISVLIGGAVAPSAQARLFARTRETADGFEVLNSVHISLVEHMNDLILALDEPQKPIYNLVAFVDLMLAHTVALGERAECLKGAEVIASRMSQEAEINVFLRSLFDVTPERLECILADQALMFNEVVEARQQEYLIYKFIFTVREFLLLGYFTAQKN